MWLHTGENSTRIIRSISIGTEQQGSEIMKESLGIMSILVGDQELHYHEQGSGEPILFVHGSLGDYRSWGPQLEWFSQHYRAVSYSRRYHYPNLWKDDGSRYSAGLHGGDLIGFIEALGLAPVSVVGASFGGYTTLLAALRRPDLMKKLVICEPPIFPWLKEIPGGGAYWESFMGGAWIPARQAFAREDMEQGVRLFLDGVLGAGSYARLPEAFRNRALDNARELMAETNSPDNFTQITLAQVAQVQIPTLLLRGEWSPKLFHLILDRLAACLPDCRQAEIPQASHSMAAMNPAAFNQTVYSFLQE